MRRLAQSLRASLNALWRAVDLEGSLLTFAIAGGAFLAASLTGDWRYGLLVLVVSAGIGALVLVRFPRGT